MRSRKPLREAHRIGCGCAVIPIGFVEPVPIGLNPILVILMRERGRRRHRGFALLMQFGEWLNLSALRVSCYLLDHGINEILPGEPPGFRQALPYEASRDF